MCGGRGDVVKKFPQADYWESSVIPGMNPSQMAGAIKRHNKAIKEAQEIMWKVVSSQMTTPFHLYYEGESESYEVGLKDLVKAFNMSRTEDLEEFAATWSIPYEDGRIKIFVN